MGWPGRIRRGGSGGRGRAARRGWLATTGSAELGPRAGRQPRWRAVAAQAGGAGAGGAGERPGAELAELGEGEARGRRGAQAGGEGAGAGAAAERDPAAGGARARRAGGGPGRAGGGWLRGVPCGSFPLAGRGGADVSDRGRTRPAAERGKARVSGGFIRKFQGEGHISRFWELGESK